MRLLRRTVCLVLIGISIGAPSMVADAQDEQIAFLDDATLVFSPPSDDSSVTSEDVVVIAGGGSELSQVSLQATGQVGPYLTIQPATTQAVESRATFTVSVDPAAEASSGFLVAFTSSGAIARRAVEIQEVAVSPEIDPPSKLSLSGWHWAPFFGFTYVRSLDVSELGVSGERELEQVLGVLQSPNGDFAKVTFNKPYIKVKGVIAAGSYTGAIHLSSTDPKQTTEVTANVRDFVVWPLIILLVGLALSQWLSGFSELRRPGHMLQVRLRRIQQRVRDAREDAIGNLRNELGDAAPPDLGLPLISEKNGTSLLLDRAVRQGYGEWLGALDQSERDEWKLSGERFKELRAYEAAFLGLVAGTVAIADTYRRIIELAAVLEGGSVADSTTLGSYRDLLGDKRVESKAELDDLVATLGSTKLMLKIREQLERLRRAKEKANDQQLQRMRTLAARLLRTTAAGIDKVVEDVTGLVDEVAGRTRKEGERYVAPSLEQEEIQEHLAASGEENPPPLTLTYAADEDVAREFLVRDLPTFRTTKGSGEAITVIAADQEIAKWLESAAEKVVGKTSPGKDAVVMSSAPQGNEGLRLQAVGVAPVPVADLREALALEPSVEELLSDLRDADSRYNKIAWTVTVLGGLTTLYFPEAAFGSLTDYLKVLLWGTAFGAGAQLARSYILAR